MELHVWSGDFGLPSWHQPCLALQAYCKFTGAPVVVRPGDAPMRAGAWAPELLGGGRGASGDLPVFVHRGERLVDFEQVVSHLEKQCRFSTDAALTARQRAEGVAFRKMVEEKLGPALAFLYWVSDGNVELSSLIIVILIVTSRTAG